MLKYILIFVGTVAFTSWVEARFCPKEDEEDGEREFD